jgi:hypothetical protein
MSEIDEISERLTVLETVVRQLVTHLAVRNDDPLGWVQTRRVLAQRAVDAERRGRVDDAERRGSVDDTGRRGSVDDTGRSAYQQPSLSGPYMHAALARFFDPVEEVVEGYAEHAIGGTDRPARR